MGKSKKTTLGLGEISSGTMRAEDIMSAVLWELDRIKLTREERNTVREIQARASKAENDREVKGEEDYFDSEEGSYDLNETLWDIMNNHCPPFCYFGSNEGDGASFGVWVSEDAISDGINMGEIHRVGPDDEDTGKIPDGALYRLVVNDHGNMALYDRKGREVWGVV